MGLATSYGIADRGQAFDTVQAMQSMHGNRKRGLAASENIFAATQVGIPIELGREVEVQGKSQGMEAGELLRYMVTGGEASGRSPQDVSTAASSLKFFDNKAFGVAYASALAGTVQPREIKTYTKRGGEALSGTSKLMPWFEEQGVGEGATQMERLAALAKKGITKQADFAAIGLDEKIQQESLMSVVPLFDTIKDITEKIRTQASDTMLWKKRVRMEEDMPLLKEKRKIDVLDSAIADADVEGPGAIPSLQLEQAEKINVKVLKDMQARQAFWFKLWDDDNRTSDKWIPVAAAHRMAIGTPAEQTAAKETPLGPRLVDAATQMVIRALPRAVQTAIPAVTAARRRQAFYGEFQQRTEAEKAALEKTDPAEQLRRMNQIKPMQSVPLDEAVQQAAGEVGYRRPSSRDNMRMNPLQADALNAEAAAYYKDHPQAAQQVPTPQPIPGEGARTVEDFAAKRTEAWYPNQKEEQKAWFPKPEELAEMGEQQSAPRFSVFPDRQVSPPESQPAAFPQQYQPDQPGMMPQAPAQVQEQPPAPVQSPQVESGSLDRAAERLVGAADVMRTAGEQMVTAASMPPRGQTGLGSPDRDK
ncbi:MAG: hypothetical protein HQ582_31750 [Planctomycetes bacterium]|nr:hypothetical protein [Planctomycetota bacterium]